MAVNEISLKWKRPESTEYPKVWHRFMARDLNSNDLVEYRIEDLCIEKANEAYEHMRENFLKDEPISDALRKLIIWFLHHKNVKFVSVNEVQYMFSIFYRWI